MISRANYLTSRMSTRSCVFCLRALNIQIKLVIYFKLLYQQNQQNEVRRKINKIIIYLKENTKPSFSHRIGQKIFIL